MHECGGIVRYEQPWEQQHSFYYVSYPRLSLNQISNQTFIFLPPLGALLIHLRRNHDARCPTQPFTMARARGSNISTSSMTPLSHEVFAWMAIPTMSIVPTVGRSSNPSPRHLDTHMHLLSNHAARAILFISTHRKLKSSHIQLIDIISSPVQNRVLELEVGLGGMLITR
jgi:hypothetical protein